MNIASYADVFRRSSPSPPQRPLSVVERLGRKKKRVRGARWEGERERMGSSLFPLPIVPRALSFFRLLLFYRDTQRELLRRREGSSKERLRGPFLLGQFTSVKTSSAKRFKLLKFFAFSCKNDKPSHLF